MSKRPKIRFGGYRKDDILSSVLFNIPAALILLTVSAPFFLIIPLIILFQDGFPLFYKGVRLGRDKKPFEMYKFRTLVKDAEQRVGGNLLNSSHRLETTTGRFLRETRLDELPQLINVLRREMDLVGPRPERPAVYEKHCRAIPGYDKRFLVRPGIIGYSQLFTPHSAPKRARTLLDNYYVRRKQRWAIDVIFFAFAIAWLAQRAAGKSTKMAVELSSRLFRRKTAANLRASERVVPPESRIEVRPKGTQQPFVPVGVVQDISDDGLAFVTAHPLAPESELEIRLSIEGRFPPRQGIKRKQARCTGRILRAIDQEDGERRYVVLYAPQRGLDLLLIHQYFLHKSIA